MPLQLNGGHEDDPDILCLWQRRSEPIQCQFCLKVLDNHSLDQRQQHYEAHFFEDPPPVVPSPITPKPLQPNPTTSPTTSPQSKVKKWRMKLNENKPRDLFWYPAQPVPPPPNYTPGLIPLLRRALTTSHSRGNSRRGVLCYNRAVHVGRESWDSGWGCGYRNFLMACAALMDQPFQPMYFPLLDHPISPSVRNLQQWIEDAWKGGFDEEGARELKKLVDTHRWIGTSDLWVAFTFRGIPVELVDFDLNRDPRGVEVLTDWVVAYFSQTSPSPNTSQTPAIPSNRHASPITITDRMPLVLQHDGHSRTIVGYEVSKQGLVNLLVFDPSSIPKAKLRKAALSLASTTASPPQSSSTSFPHTIRDFFHSIPTPSRNHKRRPSESSLTNVKKRARSGSQGNGSDDEVIVICDGDNEKKRADDDDEVWIIENDSKQVSPKKVEMKTVQSHPLEDIDAPDVLKSFRLDSKRLGRKSKYQILYFPLTAPLTESERLSRRVVISTKIC